MDSRYEQVVTELLSLAAEATIRANGEQDPGFIPWLVLSENVYGAIVAATDGLLSEAELHSLGQEADSMAIGRIGGIGTEV
jgi:hypothetical protein